MLVLSAAGPYACDAAGPPHASHAAGHAAVADSGCSPSTCPGSGSGGPSGLAPLYFLSAWNSPPIPPTSLSPDPMPPEA